MFLLDIFSLVFIGLGLVNVFNKNAAWEIELWSKRSQGLVSERTPEWEFSSTIIGIVMIIAGIGLLVLIEKSPSASQLDAPQSTYTTPGVSG